jgi:hypothetical protein
MLTRVVASLLVLLTMCGPWSEALAEPLLYTFHLVASGTVGTETFVNEAFVFAGTTDVATIQHVIDTLETDPSGVEAIIQDLAVLAGLGFIVAALFKFHQHKQNPQQLALAVEVSPSGGLTVPMVRNGSLVTVSLDSIRDGVIQFRIHRVPKK